MFVRCSCLLILMSVLLFTSCKSEISLKVLEGAHDTNSENTPAPEPPEPSRPPMAPPDTMDTGADVILNEGTNTCEDYRNIQFDYSQMPTYDIQDNVIVSTANGGTAQVKAIGVALGTGTPYNNNLNPETGCMGAWYPGGSICQFNEDTSAGVLGNNVGATWNNSSTTELMLGYIIIDLGEVKSIVGFDVFQMFSDGKATHVQIFAHSNLTSTLPTQSGAGWTEVTNGKTAIGPGALSGNLVSNPLRLPLSSELNVRYLMVYVQNNGCLGAQRYIELRSIRGYSRTR